jgi:riboflavin-specific deaminase-like protein
MAEAKRPSEGAPATPIGTRARTAVGTGRGADAFDRKAAWALVRLVADRARADDPVIGPVGLRLDAAGRLEETGMDDGWIVADASSPRGWSWPRPADGDVARAAPAAAVDALLDLYMPLCVGDASRRLVVGHLGQSLDGRIATRSGASQFITGRQDVEHAHRMRALFDAVVVGAATVENDDPRLTTRLVPGRHATRVVIDPDRRLGGAFALFHDDASPTLLVCAADAAARDDRHGRAGLVPVERGADGLPIAAVLDALRARGLNRIFIEGGGVTVSRFLAAGAVDRLHIAVAPCIMGSGRPAFSLPVIDRLSEALTFECRHFAMGPDVLFDCVITQPSAPR